MQAPIEESQHAESRTPSQPAVISRVAPPQQSTLMPLATQLSRALGAGVHPVLSDGEYCMDARGGVTRGVIVNGREPLSVVVLYHGFGVSFSDQSRFRFSVCYFDAAQDIFGTATAGCARRSAFHKMMTATEAERIDPPLRA